MRIEMEDGAEIENMYDAEGTLRQRKHIGSDDTEIAVTDYSGVWEFKNGALSRINIPGGYIQGDSVYFYIADQQGNIRQVWNASTGQTVQDNHYYPYGAMFGESAAVEYVNAMSTNLAGSSVNPYRYGGKEWLMQEGLNYYDFAARQYDPTTGRFIHPDPLNGKYPHLSSYLYCAGNPINATDPTGMEFIIDKLSPEEKAKFEENVNLRPELASLYDFIANAPEVFVVEYVENIVENSVEGKEETAVMSVRPGESENEYILSLSKNPTPSDFSFAEDLFHCFQHCNFSEYTDSHNFEYEAQVFACITITTNAHGAHPDLPFFNSMISYLGIDYFYYPPEFNQTLNSNEFLSFYLTQSKDFVDYNEKFDKGNSNYRTETKSAPFSLLKFYELYKSK